MLEAAEGGTPPRSRRLGSMIAGRRKADEPASGGRASRTEQAEEPRTGDTSGTSRSSASRSTGRRAEADEEERPARAPRAAKPEADEEADDDKPRVRRSRRGGRSRRPSDAAGEQEEREAEDTAEEQAPAAVARPAAKPAPTEDEDDSADAEVAEPRPRRTATRRAASTAAPEVPAALLDEIQSLRASVVKQERMLEVLAGGIDNLGERITFSGYRPRIAVFVDVPNLIYGYEGDGSLHMGKILNLLTEGRDLVRATAYSPVSDDPREPMEQQRFVAPFVPFEYRIVTKPLKRFADGSIKGNFDVEMAIDMVLMADRVDVMAIVSGDADFARAVEAVQQKGVRVEVIAFAGSTSLEMRALADHYLELGRVVDKIL